MVCRNSCVYGVLLDKAKMSETDPQNVRDNDISEEELALEIGESPSVKEKKKRRKQGIVGLIASNPNITVDMLSEKMGEMRKPFVVTLPNCVSKE